MFIKFLQRNIFILQYVIIVEGEVVRLYVENIIGVCVLMFIFFECLFYDFEVRLSVFQFYFVRVFVKVKFREGNFYRREFSEIFYSCNYEELVMSFRLYIR